ncbi:MAG: LppX_LprAFG lipoprotein [Ilumatobacter sp.]
MTTRFATRGRRTAVPLMLAVALVGCGDSGTSEPTEPTIPARADAIVAASATAMGDTTSVRFELRREGAPVFIDEFERLTLNSAIGEFAVPGSARALLEVGIEGGLATELGAIALGNEVWLSNPITGNFETLPPGYDIDPSLFFDPKNGWQPLMENLSDVVLVGTEERDGNARYHVNATAPAAQVEVITARLVRNQDVAIDFWIQPVTGEVREARFAADFNGAEVRWTLLLDDYGAEFEIEPPEGLSP